MGYRVIAPVGDNLEALFVGMKEFPTQEIYLLCPVQYKKRAAKVAKQLEVFSIPVHIKEITGSLMEGMFSSFATLCSQFDHDELIVNVATGDRLSTCAALSAAFANGLKAFGVMDGKPMLLPIMKLSYYHELSESKLKILQALDSEKFITLSELAKSLNMSVSLLSYHLNGTRQYKGLKSLRLVEMKEERKHLLIKLSEMGALLLKGYISCEA